MCSVASLTPDPEFMSAHVVGKVGERRDTDGDYYRAAEGDKILCLHIQGSAGSITSQSLAEVVKSSLAESPHDGQTLHRSVLNRSQ